MDFEGDLKTGLVGRGRKKTMNATAERRWMAAREGVTEVSSDRDRALCVGRGDKRINIEHRGQFRSGINAVRQNRAPKKNDRNADPAESCQQSIDALLAGDGGAPIMARQSDKSPPNIVRDKSGSLPGKSRNHRLY